MSSSTSSSRPDEARSTASTAATGAGRRIRRLLVFVALLAVVFIILGQILEAAALNIEQGAAKVRDVMQLKGQQCDVVYVGDSTVLEDVNPAVVDEALGIRSYNLGTGGQTSVATELVLRHYLSRNAKPRLVVMSVFINREDVVGPFIGADVYAALSQEHRELYRRYLESRGTPLPLTWRIGAVFKAYNYRGAIAPIIKFLIAGRSRIPRFIQGHMAFDFSRPIELGLTHDAMLDPAEFQRVVDLCIEEKLPLLIFEPPNNPGYSERTRGREKVVAYLESLPKTYDSIQYRSFNDAGSLDYALDEWAARNHLNAKGAIRFTGEQIVPYVRDFLK